jgi:hypothetical protein
VISKLCYSLEYLNYLAQYSTNKLGVSCKNLFVYELKITFFWKKNKFMILFLNLKFL